MFNKKIVLKALTPDLSVSMNAPIVYGEKLERPSWLKSIKSTVTHWNERIGLYDKSGTVAVCPGIREYLSKPIHINMWEEVDIRITPDGSWTNTPSNAGGACPIDISEHPEDQWRGMYPGKRVALKLTSPWKFTCNQDIGFLFTESHYSTSYFRERDIWLSPGYTNFKWQHSTNVHLNCPVKDEPYVITLKHGMPLISLFPLTERKLDLQIEKIDFNTWAEIGEHFPKIKFGKYYKQPGFKK